ncbi:hypothetical protein H261_09018 [Paramagnetospirillum caucaseum]|uniref:Uncharacterized protein n=1 Tax=Paramagnetospirillum caucaseum TaxID=1244869 RepID=M2Z7L5_9PROT|nr:hypothetical protein [Paramagnetospirillum caucaseum]EME70315.1 hypothetical protein H261_09018 [Paramagnetospirillum caucaseum]
MPTSRLARDADIDWDLLRLLARTEAALTWPDGPPDEPEPSIPQGLDLRHPGDLDLVSRTVMLAELPARN